MQSGAEDQFEGEFTREIQKAERLRSLIIAAVLAVFLGIFLAVTTAFPDGFDRIFKGKLSRTAVVVFGLACMAFELALYWRIGNSMRRGKKPPFGIRTFVATVEILTATAGLQIATVANPPLIAVLMPGLLVYTLFITASVLRLDFWLCAFTGAMSAFQYLVLVRFHLHDPANDGLHPALLLGAPHIGRAMILTMGGLVAGVISLELRRRFRSAMRHLAERNRIHEVFGQHVSPEVVEKLLAQRHDLPAETRHVCVMFLDIRGFTRFSEGRSPEDVVSYLNSLFSFMVDEVSAKGGIVNKFLGDGFLAVFGAPISDGKDVQNAYDASRAILARVDELNRTKSIPPTRIGIGLHAGSVLTGNVGSPQRKEYTIIGDTVNLASRIEALNKDFDSSLLVSDEVLRVLGPRRPRSLATRRVKIRGRTGTIRVHRLA